MKVTVWGGSGFLGSHVCDVLTENRHEVTIADTIESQWKKNEQRMLVGSILDHDSVNESVKNADYVFNFAGIADIDEANKNPISSANINIIGNINLLDACVRAKVDRYIFASSLYVYSNSGGFYRCSKQACEGYIDEYYRQFNLKCTVLRFGSLYGLRSDEHNAIYRFIKEALTEKKINYFGSPDALREYVHVEDAAQMCNEFLDGKYTDQHITITGHQSIRVGQLLEMISEMLDDGIELDFHTENQNQHYKITPYSFNPRLGKKYSPELHIDMGQGLLQLLHTIQKQVINGE